jgi:Flp pilus assembly pilin Flp
MRFLLRFVRDEDGQDVIEYALGVAFVALASAAFFASAESSTRGIWGQANNTLAGANTSAAAPPSDAPPPTTPPGSGGGDGDGGDHHHHHGGGGGFDGGGGHYGHSGGE